MSRLNFNKIPLKIARTENNALAYQTLGDPIKDMFATFGAMRNASDEQILKCFSDAFNFDADSAVKLLFFFRDAREGQKEKRIFDVVFQKWISDNNRLAYAFLPFIPEYGYWKQIVNYMIFAFANRNLEFFDFAANLYAIQLSLDSKSEHPTLAAKYALDENFSRKSPTNKRIFDRYMQTVMRVLELTGFHPKKEYRKVLSNLRKQLDVVEVKMSAQDWYNIEYGKVPSVAHKLYRKAFGKHDQVGYQRYLNRVEKGEDKINAGVLTPVDIIKTYTQKHWERFAYDQTLEAQWKAQAPVKANVLVVSDVSGSMEMNDGLPMMVSVSLGIYFAQNSVGWYHNHLVTFSTSPEYIVLDDNKSLKKCIETVYKSNWNGSTDLNKTFNLILQAAVYNDVPAEEMPEWLLIISDMQFNHASNFYTPFEVIQENFKNYGYRMPKVVFWNVRASESKSFPAPDSNGVFHVSGYSPNVFKMLLANLNGDVLQEVLNSPRYRFVERVL